MLIYFAFNTPQKNAHFSRHYSQSGLLSSTSNKKMVSSQFFDSTYVGSINVTSRNDMNEDVVEVKPTSWNPKIWCNFNYFIMNDGIKSLEEKLSRILQPYRKLDIEKHVRNAYKVWNKVISIWCKLILDHIMFFYKNKEK